MSDFARSRPNPRFQPADPAAADRDRIGIRRIQFHHAVVASPLEPHHALDIDDVAAMHPQEPGSVEARFHVADRQRAEQLRRSIEDICVVGIGVHRDDGIHGDVMREAVALYGEMLRKSPRWPAGSAERATRTVAQDRGPRGGIR